MLAGVRPVVRRVSAAPVPEKMVTIDGNHAASYVAYNMSEMAILFPITPATPMGELADAWSVKGIKNAFGTTTKIHQMQSEGGVAGALHGALLSGTVTATFTSSQGLLLMIPNMYKISGELLPGVMHVATRNIGTHSQCIYPEHSDLMTVRSTGWPILYSSNVQECQDLAVVAHLAAMEASLPFVHAFDGFRTSHEISKISEIQPETLKSLMDFDKIAEFRKKALNPNKPTLFGTIASDQTSFQSTEALAPYYSVVPDVVERMMKKVEKVTGRHYDLFSYYGPKDAEHVIVVMGSGAGPVKDTVDYMTKKGQKVGLVNVHLFRPFSQKHILNAIPKTAKTVTVLDRVREQTAGEPLYLDVVEAFATSNRHPKIFNGVFGLGGFSFTPSMALTIYENAMSQTPKAHFTVGIEDDVMHNSLPAPKEIIDAVPEGTVQCMFYGLGSDGTIGANKEAISLIADFQTLWAQYAKAHPEEAAKKVTENFMPGKTYGDLTHPLYCQGYFAYDAKKSGGLTVSHLRFGPKPIESQYCIDNADYIACHNPSYITKYDMAAPLKNGGKMVLNTPYTTLEELEKHLPNRFKRLIAQKHGELYVIDAFKIAKQVGLGQRINMVMQTVFYGLSNVLPLDNVMKLMKESIQKQYGKKGKEVVQKNYAAADLALPAVVKINYPKEWANLKDEPHKIDPSKPDFVNNWMDVVDHAEGGKLKVSEQIVGAGMPTNTTKYEKRGIAVNVPKWNKEKCVQCGMCSISCPHAALRAYLLSKEQIKNAPEGYQSLKAKGKGLKDFNFSIQVSPLDCMGCGLCASVCPAGALKMVPLAEELPQQKNFDYSYEFQPSPELINKFTIKGASVQRPYLEFHGACPGCGEAPYVKLLSSLYGERLSIAGASGCNVVWMGTQGWNPFAVNKRGQGPVYANSLFEDNAEFGFGINASMNVQRSKLKTRAENLIKKFKANPSKFTQINEEFIATLEKWIETFSDGEANKPVTDKLQEFIDKIPMDKCGDEDLCEIIIGRDSLLKQCIWILGGDGWAYDIGFGGLDHVLASGQDVNVLVIDTNVYSNTGGQKSKATPIGAVAKFAAGGNMNPPKDLARIFMSYNNVYCASISLGYDPAQAIKAIKEAESYNGPSLVVAYCPCINQGPKKGMMSAFEQEKLAVETGLWQTFRYDPRKEKPLQMDCPPPTRPIDDYLKTEVRFTSLSLADPAAAKVQRDLCANFVKNRREQYEKIVHSQE